MIRRALVVSMLLLAMPVAAQTTGNDSSCDISVAPAATLLLPYFEVEFAQPQVRARTTLFTVVNTSAQPQIARATIWTDWAYPVMSFDLFLTGYDVASVNLYDILHGRLPDPAVATPGAKSLQNSVNPNHTVTAVSDCNARPAAIPQRLLNDLRAALTNGRPTGDAICRKADGFATQIGSNYSSAAIGYITIDLVAGCSGNLPTEAGYFTSELLFDNVLIGDWMLITPDPARGNYAAASPMVHIRAVPEGGRAGSVVPTPLPYTFHTRLTSRLPESQRKIDRRQPLPSVFGVRFIEGGTTHFQTRLAIWREAITGPDPLCVEYAENGELEFSDVVRFDEHENANIFLPPSIPVPVAAATFPVTRLVDTASTSLPRLNSPHGDISGWLYLNLGRYSKSRGLVVPGAGQQQAWVVVSMFAEGRYAHAFDAVALANGCTPPPPAGAPIGKQ